MDNNRELYSFNKGWLEALHSISNGLITTETKHFESDVTASSWIKLEDVENLIIKLRGLR